MGNGLRASNRSATQPGNENRAPGPIVAFSEIYRRPGLPLRPRSWTAHRPGAEGGAGFVIGDGRNERLRWQQDRRGAIINIRNQLSADAY
jgi:hypothetical protein